MIKLNVFYLLPIALTLAACESPQPVVKRNPGFNPTVAESSGIVQPGIIKVRRQGEEYDVQLELDVGTDNVVFLMDMPSDSVEVEKDGELVEPEVVEDLEDEEMPIEEIAEIEPPKDDLPAPQTPTKLETNVVTSNIVRAQTYFYEGRYFESMSAIDQALTVDPSNAVAHAIKGSVFYQLGNRNQAIYYWKTALKLDPSLDDVRQGLKTLGMEGN